MLANSPATAMIPAHNVERALAWYRDKLGITPAHSDEHGAALEFNGVKAFLYKSEYAGTAEHTILSFSTKDLVRDKDELGAKGVVFLDYDLPDLKTENGIAAWGPVKNAWCKDSEGNILGLVEGMD